MGKRLAAMAVLGMLLVAAPAAAHTKGVDDEDDTRGSLDLRRVSLGHDDDTITVMWRSWETFGPGPFHDGGWLEIWLHAKSGHLTTMVTVDHRDGKWLAELENRDTGETKVVPVTRPFPKIARVVIPRSFLPQMLQEKLWWTAASRLDGEPGASSPMDFLPDYEVSRGHDLTKD